MHRVVGPAERNPNRRAKKAVQSLAFRWKLIRYLPAFFLVPFPCFAQLLGEPVQLVVGEFPALQRLQHCLQNVIRRQKNRAVHQLAGRHDKLCVFPRVATHCFSSFSNSSLGTQPSALKIRSPCCSVKCSPKNSIISTAPV